MLPPLHYCWGRCCSFFMQLVGAQSSTVLPPPTLLLGQMLPVFYTVGGAILYCATPPYTTVGADAARFLYGRLRDPLLRYPPLHHCWGRCCPFFFIRLAARTSTVLPPPYTAVGTDAARLLYGRRVERPFTVLPPYTTSRLNAACFGAMSVGVLGDPSLCYPPTLHLG